MIGASAGGVEALLALVGGLPGGFPAALLVVLHIGSRRSHLPAVLDRAGRLRAAWAEDGEKIRPGRIRIAPPDRHLLVAARGDTLKLSRGPRENRTRPAIDPLFRSAARACGRRLAGVVLSGMQGDGTAGLAEIGRHGGLTIVQDPREAAYPQMPRAALRHVTVGHCLPVAAIAGLLVRVCGPGPATAMFGDPAGMSATGMEETADMAREYKLKRPVALTCPNCGGALTQTLVDSLPYFECHIGHRFAARNMDEAQFDQLEQALDVALRVLNERAELCRGLAEAARGRGQAVAVRHWEAAMRESTQRATVLRRFNEQGWKRPSDDGGEGDFAVSPARG
ncbi:chemotaxis protein CheB [Rhodovastum atsumiense]|uniref:chemotaxis protein CheB n=1 Tax=Rhodovastum atsumiense TaxID=504468 RepID=UPI001EF155B9|nr:chemotaxis protein CheB [Rhodovastum atsumiense]